MSSTPSGGPSACEPGGGRNEAALRRCAVNTRTEAAQWAPTVTVGGDGDFFVAWTSAHEGTGEGVFGQRFDRDGQRLGGEHRVDVGSYHFNRSPSAALAADGTLVVVWESSSIGHSGSFDVFGRRFVVESADTRDRDGDGIPDGVDNCPTVRNPEQTDVAGAGYGDDCVSPDVVIPPDSRFGANPVIGRGSTIGAGVVVGDDATLGELVHLDRLVRAGDGFFAEDLVSIGRRVTLGNDVAIGFATRIDGAVVIGSSVSIGDQVHIRRNVTVGDGARIDALVIVYSAARIGEGATIEMGASIGRGATIRPGALVPTGTTVPPFTTFP